MWSQLWFSCGMEIASFMRPLAKVCDPCLQCEVPLYATTRIALPFLVETGGRFRFPALEEKKPNWSLLKRRLPYGV